MREDIAAPNHPLMHVLDRLAHLLPAQGPISIFIHHNTLRRCLRSTCGSKRRSSRRGERLGRGREPFLSQSRYREKLASGRILARDVEALLDRAARSRSAPTSEVAGTGPRLDLWRAVVLHGFPEAIGQESSWILEETEALSRFRTDVPASARSASAALGELDDRAGEERRAVRRLWNACVDAVGRAGEPPPVLPPHAPGSSSRLASGRVTASTPTRGSIRRSFDSWRATSIKALRTGPMPETDIAASTAASSRSTARRWRRSAATGHERSRALVADDRAAGRQRAQLDRELPRPARCRRRRARRLSERRTAGPARVGRHRASDRRAARPRAGAGPHRDAARLPRGPPAVRTRGARPGGATARPSPARSRDLRPWLRAPAAAPPAPPTALERAWPLFHVAQLRGLDASIVEQWTARHVAELESRAATSSTACAGAGSCTRRSSGRFVIACTTRSCSTRREALPERPAFQAVFCLDEREESFRRHLEEVEPACETFGTAGFFNVAMYHQGVSDAHPRPLCPVAIRPDHYVAEIEPDGDGLSGTLAASATTRRGVPRLQRAPGEPAAGPRRRADDGVRLAGADAARSCAWSSRGSRHDGAACSRRRSLPSRTRLQLDRSDAAPPIGKHSGFTVREMADIVRRVLEDIGIRDRLSSLVLVIGHGSISLNNPHESAHDCGACGGGRGGPNARAFAQMANDARVRRAAGRRGAAHRRDHLVRRRAPRHRRRQLSRSQTTISMRCRARWWRASKRPLSAPWRRGAPRKRARALPPLRRRAAHARIPSKAALRHVEARDCR